jgi:hypothetical protein
MTARQHRLCAEEQAIKSLKSVTLGFSERAQQHPSEYVSQILRSGVVMGRQSHRKTADVLRRTIEQLEADPTIDTLGAPFVDLKCNLLNRILELEEGKARAESVIHLVDSPLECDTEAADTRTERDSDSAIA